MAIILRKIKTLNPKKALSVVLLAGITALALSYLPAGSQTTFAGPKFDAFPIAFEPGVEGRDLPMIDAQNVTIMGTDWSKASRTVPGRPNDIIFVQIYYHNGAADHPDNTARNVVVTAFANPSLGTQSASHVLSASISGSNFPTVTSGGRGGNITVQMQGGSQAPLSLVPGSVQHLPDRGSRTIQLPDNIFSGSSIGDIRGCWEFTGFVQFKLRVGAAVQPGDLQVKKEVKNVSDTTGFFDNEVSADPDETVEFRITVSATSNRVQNVTLSDSKDPKLIFIGEVRVDGQAVNNNSFFSSGGAGIGTIEAGSSKTAVFQAKVAPRSQFTSGLHVLTNQAVAQGEGKQAQDSANVRVDIAVVRQVSCPTVWDPPLVPGTNRGLRKVGDQANVRIRVTGLEPNQSFTIVDKHASGSPEFRATRQADAAGNFEFFSTDVISSSFAVGDYNVFIEVGGTNVANCPGFKIEAAPVVVAAQLDLQKLVKNENLGGNFVEDQVEASPGHLITFQIIIKNKANATQSLQNVIVRDSLPDKLNFVGESFRVEGTQRSNPGFFGTGFHLNEDIGAGGGQKVITFQATVKSASNFTSGQCENLVNSATGQATGVSADSDTANVRVCVSGPVKQPGAPAARPLDP